MQLFTKVTQDKTNRDNSPTLGNSNSSASLSSAKPNFHVENSANENRLEIRIIHTTDDFQDVEIVCGKKRKRIRITKAAKFLSPNLTSDPIVTKLQATHIGHLKHEGEKSPNLLGEKLLNALAKINLLVQTNKNGVAVDYQKVWDGPKRIVIDAKFDHLSEAQRQKAFDEETQKRTNYLSTSEKAVLVAAANYLRGEENKIDRSIVSKTFTEINDKNSFQNFVTDLVNLVANTAQLASVFFGKKTQNLSTEKSAAIAEDLSNILAEFDVEKRKSKIKNFVKSSDQFTAQTLSK